ncbi:MAG: sugar nucleotide-binding protein, partial [Fusobacteriaceae bacterium]
KSSDFVLPAPRAEYSKLDSSKLESVIGEKLPTWESGIDRFLQEMREKEN